MSQSKRDKENLLEIKFLPNWARTPQFAAVCVGFTALFNPGLWGSIVGLGGSGIADAGVANTANAIIFGTLAVFGLITPVITNRIGVKQALIIGASFYAPYAGALYHTARHPENKWFLPFSAFLLGVSAAHLWVASGSILLGYALHHQKGRNMSIKFALQNTGGLVGGAVSMGLNHVKTDHKSVSGATFLVLTGLILCGIPFALLLPTPRQVIRSDRSPVILKKQPTFWKEFGSLVRIIKHPRVFILFPVLIYNQWWISYQAAFNGHYYNIRARALNSFLSHLFAAVGAVIAGFLLDNSRITRATRARIGYSIFFTLGTILWILLTIIQKKWINNTTVHDWGGFGSFIYIFWGFVDGSINTLLYWVIGTLSDNVNEISILTGFVNSIGSLGSAMAFAMSARNAKMSIQGGMNAGLFFFSLPFFAFAIWKVGDEPVFKTRIDEETEPESNDRSSTNSESELKERVNVEVKGYSS